MSFQDIDDKDPVVFVRPATTIAFTVPEGEKPIPPIELPEVRIRRSEASPAWLALHDAEQAERTSDEHEAGIARMVEAGFRVCDPADDSPEMKRQIAYLNALDDLVEEQRIREEERKVQ